VNASHLASGPVLPGSDSRLILMNINSSCAGLHDKRLILPAFGTCRLFVNSIPTGSELDVSQ
jgi:hypothetical protein